MNHVFAFLKNLLHRTFGEIHWSPPAWCSWIADHRKTSAFWLLALVALTTGGFHFANWWEHRPKPKQIVVTVRPIELTSLAEKLEPRPMQIDFSESAAPLDAVNKRVTHGITLNPAAEGEWHWTSDQQLVFQPKNDWPAAQTYRIRIEPGLVRNDVPLDQHKLTITTPDFAGTIRELNFYQSPKDPAVRQVVATLHFTHPILRGELEARDLLDVLGKSEVFPAGKPHFTVEYAMHNRVAYIRSAPLKLPPSEDFARLILPQGLKAARSGKTRDEVVAKVKLPDRYGFFRINSVVGNIARKDDGEPEQVLIVETTADIDPKIVAGALEVRLLPPRNWNYHDWQSPREITPEILAQSQSVPLTLIPQDRPISRMISFKLKLEQKGKLYVRIKQGIEALGGYPLGKDYDTVLSVPEPPRELTFQSEGGLLALAGERKLSVKSRGIPGISYEISRVQADQINHLVSQTSGDFKNPNFSNYRFNEENISKIAEEKQPIQMGSRFTANYATFDFSKHLALPADGGTERGLFFLKAKTWNPQTGSNVGPEAESRFILVTDLGLLAKFNSDGSSTVFVASLKLGAPSVGVQVDLIGKNGNPLVSGQTLPDGSVMFPKLTDTRREKEPVAFVARQGDDVSFLPYNREDRELDFSRFDIEGVSNINPEALDAFAFSERGIYRPGDTVHLAFAVKQRNWAGNLEGLPIEIEVNDARGKSASVKRLTLTREAISTFDFATRYESPAGQYDFNIYLVKSHGRDIRIGGSTFIVKEFLPDRMKLETKLNKISSKGWIAPEDVKAELTLRNLYGTPASKRRIVSTLTLSPTGFSFEDYPDYTFYDRMLDEEKHPRLQQIELPEQTTSDEGTAAVDFNLESYANATWKLNYYAEAFEGNSGRCVTGQAGALVSAQPYLIGHKADGDLSFVQVGTVRSISFVAINSSLEHFAIEKLEGRVIEQIHISTLVKKDNGDYGYESLQQEKEVSRTPTNLPLDGLTWTIPTITPGNFFYELWNSEGQRVARVGFRIVGVGGLARSLDRNAELEIHLDKAEYNSGDTMKVSIRAPYTGSGLITIESNRVHSHAWFHTNTVGSVQEIVLPSDFEGSGYVSVAFVRSLDSQEIFMSPLSYGVASFKANFEKRRVHIELGVPKEMKPGEPLAINYHTDRPTKIILFAVDKGILQVTNYATPDPLGWFFRKTRLETRTTQIVDLLIPEFSLLRQFSAPGGGEEGKLNPFRRVTERPVVWWSGTLDADSTSRTANYEVPDYFSGTLQVMAVAISPDAAGSAETPVLVRGPFIITPGVPLAVAPGDEFEAGVTVANNCAGSGEDATVKLAFLPSEHLEIIGSGSQDLKIPENKEISTSIRVRAKQKLGAANLQFTASANNQSSQLTTTLSVRPATPFMVELRSKNFRKGNATMPMLGGWHKEYYQASATVSTVPLGLARGLEFYLKNFPYGCSEQITSGAFARMVLSDEADFGQSRSLVQEQMNSVYDRQRSRQAGNGAFGYWTSEESHGADFISVYVMHFLIEAKSAGFNPPADLIQSGLKHLREIAAMDPSSMEDARTISYAIYLLTREETITTNYLLNLQDSMDRRWKKSWTADLTSSYLAASWKMLKKNDVADKLIQGYKLGSVAKSEFDDFYDDFSADSRYLALLARHFPDRLRKITPEDYARYLEPIGEGKYSTLSAAYAVLALKSYAQLVAVNPPRLTGQLKGAPLKLEGKQVLRADLPLNVDLLTFGVDGKPGPLGVFAQTMEAGFQIVPPKYVVNDGMEVWRELVDEHGAALTKIELGKPLIVRIVARSKEKRNIANVAVVSLVPGGFEVVPDSIKAGRSNLTGVNFVEVREDRVVLFGELINSTREWQYQLRPVSIGKYIVPPAFAESMYDRKLKSHGVSGTIEVVQP